MSGGIIAILEDGPRLKELIKLLDICCEEIDDCEFCSERRGCADYCDTHLYNFNELTEYEYQKHLAAIMRRRQIRKRVRARRVCEIEYSKVRHQEISSLVCGGF